MPFAEVNLPSPALSLLKPVLQKEGIVCDVRYLNIDFAAFVNHDEAYRAVNVRSIAGEWVFSEELFGDLAPPYEAGTSTKRDSNFLNQSELDVPLLRDNLQLMRSKAHSFIEWCLKTINWDNYDIIGFSSMASQHVASLALAKNIKRLWPDKIIAFGGVNCLDTMGQATLRLFPFVDWVFMGYSELSFPEAIKRYIAGEMPEDIPGVAYRQNDVVITQGQAHSDAMDNLPYPDFDDYLAAFEKWDKHDLPFMNMLIELSRGCWWGEKHNCIFCGINSLGLTYRNKSPERSYAEITSLVERYGIDNIHFTDCILNMQYYETLLPAITKWNRNLNLYFQLKTNLTRHQVSTLKSAGVHEFQPGIESLDSETLKYMHKGTTLLQNVQLLKWARECGIAAKWNILYGFPGEQTSAYYRMASVVPSLVHLFPPMAVTPVRLQRFSPLFNNPEEWGLHNIRASLEYRAIYPFEQNDLDDLAYSFNVDFDGKENIVEYTRPLLEAVENWVKYWSANEPPMLAFERNSNGGLTIYDTRPCHSTSIIELEGDEAIAYLACDAKHSFSFIAAEVKKQRGKGNGNDTALRRDLDDLVERRLMLREGDQYLSLANDLAVLEKNINTMLPFLLAHKAVNCG